MKMSIRLSRSWFAFISAIRPGVALLLVLLACSFPVADSVAAEDGLERSDQLNAPPDRAPIEVTIEVGAAQDRIGDVKSRQLEEIEAVTRLIEAGALDKAEIMADQLTDPLVRTISLAYVAEALARNGNAEHGKSFVNKLDRAAHRDRILMFVSLGLMQQTNDTAMALAMVESLGREESRIFVICAAALFEIRLGFVEKAKTIVRSAEIELMYLLSEYEAAAASGWIAAIYEEAGAQFEADKIKAGLWRYSNQYVLTPIFHIEKYRMKLLVINQ